MIQVTRRTLFKGLGGLFLAPAIVRATSIMSIKAQRSIMLLEGSIEYYTHYYYYDFLTQKLIKSK